MNTKCLIAASLAGLVMSARAADVASRVKADFADYGARAFVHYAVDPMSDAQRLPDTYPTDGVTNGVVRIDLARGEYEPGAFEVFATRDLGKVTFTLGDLVTSNGVKFAAKDLDLKFVKCWYQNLNAWFSYFGDNGDWKLCSELLVNDEDIIRTDEKKKANYARIVGKDGKTYERWFNMDQAFDSDTHGFGKGRVSAFQSMAPGFSDAKTLQPVNLPKETFKCFYLAVHTDANTKSGVYNGSIALTDAQGKSLGSIPVSVCVHDFELPHPMCYRDLKKDFLVSFYHYGSLHYTLEYNGGDKALAKRQMAEYYRNFGRHNQTMIAIPFVEDNELWYTIDIMRDAGMRTDVLMCSIAVGWYSTDTEVERNRARRWREIFDNRLSHHNIYNLWGDEPALGAYNGSLYDARRSLTDFMSEDMRVSIAGSQCVFNRCGFMYDWPNISQKPEWNRLLQAYNDAGAEHVAWYANQHVGAENPCLNRRQNGLAGYLAGYTALCNYAHHFGEMNDSSGYYKPMCYTYGTYDGFIDTLAWEGFREGVDDIRYATLLLQLAEKAEASPDSENRELGRLAQMFLARFDGQNGDLTCCRQEMIVLISRLLKIVKPYPVEPYRQYQKNEKAMAEYRADYERAAKKFAAAKPGVEQAEAEKDLVAVTKRMMRPEDLIPCYDKAGLWDKAAKACENALAFDHAKEMGYPERILRDTNASIGARRNAAWDAISARPELTKDPILYDLFSQVDTNKFVRSMWNDRWSGICAPNNTSASRFPAVIWFYELVTAMADKAGIKDISYAATENAFRAYMSQGDVAKAEGTLRRALAYDALKAGDRYRLGLLSELLKVMRGGEAGDAREKRAYNAVAAFDKANRGEMKGAERIGYIQGVGTLINVLNDEYVLRGVIAYRDSLYVPMPKKRYTVKYAPKTVAESPDWNNLGVAVETAVFDRPFGGSTDMMATDVTTGTRAVGSSGETIPRTKMQVVADDWGVHFRFYNADPKARSIQKCLTPGGSFEGYLAPGKNEPYICFFGGDGGNDFGDFNTTYDTFGLRQIDPRRPDTVRHRVSYTDEAIVTYLGFSWENYAGRIPEKGKAWDFECMRWDRAGGDTWNGTRSIHERSTWGELVFDMPAAARARILRRLALQAYRKFLAEVDFKHGSSQYEGCVYHWKDPWTGDPEFYEKVLAPFVDELTEAGKDLSLATPDAKIFELEKNGTIGKWIDIVFWTSRLRTRWLQGMGAK